MENLDDVLEQLKQFNVHCNDLLAQQWDCNTISLGETNISETSTDVLDVVKKARKVDFNTISYARKSYEEGLRMNLKYGLNINFVADYNISLDELKEKSITNLILENPNERDCYWVVDFTKELIYNIKKEIENNSTFRYVNGKCVRLNNPDQKAIRKYVKKLMYFRNDADKEFLKLLDEVLEFEFDKDCTGAPIMVEEDLKNDLLNEDFDELSENIKDIDDVLEYNIYHVKIKKCAREILESVQKLLEEGYTPKDLDLKIEDDWCKCIYEFLNGTDLIEDEDLGFETLNEKLEEEYKEYVEDIVNEKRRIKKENKANAVKYNAKKSITIKRISDGEVLSFETKGDCMKYLNTSPNTFSQFLKGKSKLNKKYTIEEV